MSLADDLFGIRKGINSKQKGKRNEQSLANALTTWAGMKFRRVPMSGALRLNSTAHTTGDIFCDEPDYDLPFTIETKHLSKLFTPSVLRANSVVFTIWQQALADAERSSKVPVMFLRENQMPRGDWYFIISDEYMHRPDLEPLFVGDPLVGYSFKKLKKELNFEGLCSLLKNN